MDPDASVARLRDDGVWVCAARGGARGARRRGELRQAQAQDGEGGVEPRRAAHGERQVREPERAQLARGVRRRGDRARAWHRADEQGAERAAAHRAARRARPLAGPLAEKLGRLGDRKGGFDAAAELMRSGVVRGAWRERAAAAARRSARSRCRRPRPRASTCCSTASRSARSTRSVCSRPRPCCRR